MSPRLVLAGGKGRGAGSDSGFPPSSETTETSANRFAGRVKPASSATLPVSVGEGGSAVNLRPVHRPPEAPRSSAYGPRGAIFPQRPNVDITTTGDLPDDRESRARLAPNPAPQARLPAVP